MIYHPLASILVQILEQKTIRYSKDFIEIGHIQSASGTAEKFASVSISTFVKAVKYDIAKKFQGTLFTSTILNTLEEDVCGTRPSRLLFNPIDTFTNLSRAIPNFGISFLLQEDTGKGIQNIFSLAYLFQTQEIIYCDGRVVDIRGRNLKPVVRKNHQFCVLANNTDGIKNQEITQKFGTSIATNSIITDIHYLAKGKIDAINYVNIPLIQVAPVQIIANTMLFNNNPVEIIIDKSIEKKVGNIFFAAK